MKIIKTEITPAVNEHVSIILRDEPYFKSPFHFHPELELVYIIEGAGKRIIGDKVESFSAGDMVFVGKDLPHVWLNDEIHHQDNSNKRAKAIVMYFNPSILGAAFFQMKEAALLKGLLARAEKGLQVYGTTRSVIADKLKILAEKKDFERIIGLFEILHLLSTSEEINQITSDGYTTCTYNKESDRLAEVYKYVHENFKNDISLAIISSIACFTPPSFCRFFKQKTGKHFIEYLNEVRIAKACHYLLDTDWTISEIAFNCGYKTASNFNKLFREIKGTSPKAYRESACVMA